MDSSKNKLNELMIYSNELPPSRHSYLLLKKKINRSLQEVLIEEERLLDDMGLDFLNELDQEPVFDISQ